MASETKPLSEEEERTYRSIAADVPASILAKLLATLAAERARRQAAEAYIEALTTNPPNYWDGNISDRRAEANRREWSSAARALWLAAKGPDAREGQP
jgi:hypothetical protein